MKPFVFVNVAASIDGKISDERRVQLRISCEEDLRRVDELRASSDAVMVGIGTVLSDNPRLTVKSAELRTKRVEEGKGENPIRVVVDSRCRIPVDSEILNDDAETIVAVSERAEKGRVETIRKKAKAEVVVLGKELVDLKALMDYLWWRGIRKLMVEGGATLISSLFAENLVDEIYVYHAPMVIGGKNSPTVCDGKSLIPPRRLKLIDVSKVGEGVVTRWEVKK